MEWVIFINHREKFSHWIFAGRTEPRLAVADIFISLSFENFHQHLDYFSDLCIM